MKAIETTVHHAAAPSESTSALRHVCPVCLDRNAQDFFVVKNIPVHVCVLEKSPAEAFAAPRGDIVLAACHACGHVFNRTYESAKVTFDPTYEASLEHSPTFCAYIEEVAARLTRRYHLEHKNLIEVGCGSGFFLKTLCERGENYGTGFDPSVIHQGPQLVDAGALELVRDFYDARYAHIPCDFLCCLSVIEGIDRPLAFLKSIRAVLGDRPVKCYFEVYNGERPFTRDESFSIHYEQCNYFSPRSLAALVAGSGFEVLHSGKSYQGDQYLYVEARTIGKTGRFQEISDSTNYTRVIESFTAHHQDRMKSWRKRLCEYAARSRKVVLWGSGGKGISFLNMLPTSGVIDYVVEINPRRQGLFIPGSGQEIVSPEFLQAYQPDAVLVSNPLYEREIRQKLASLNITCDVTTI